MPGLPADAAWQNTVSSRNDVVLDYADRTGRNWLRLIISTPPQGMTVDADTGLVTDTQDHVVATLGEQVTIGGGFEPEILAFRVGSITRADPASAASR
jgi:hypothetical protein